MHKWSELNSKCSDKNEDMLEDLEVCVNFNNTLIILNITNVKQPLSKLSKHFHAMGVLEHIRSIYASKVNQFVQN